jgi:hypothetical protein
MWNREENALTIFTNEMFKVNFEVLEVDQETFDYLTREIT